jgi:hypothetical protein
MNGKQSAHITQLHKKTKIFLVHSLAVSIAQLVENVKQLKKSVEEEIKNV